MWIKTSAFVKTKDKPKPVRLSACLAFLLILTLATSAFTAESRIKTLIITGGHGFETNAFFQVFKNNPEIDATNVSHGKSNAPVSDSVELLTFDVVVCY